MGDVRVPVHVVPPRVHEHPLVGHTRLPLVRLVEAETDNVAAVRLHGEHGVDRTVPAAPQVAAAPLGNEDYAAVGQEARVEIVRGAVGQLHQPGPVGVHLEQMIAVLRAPDVEFLALRLLEALRVGVGEKDGAAVEGDLGRQKRPAFELAPGHAPALDDRVLQQIDESGIRPEGIVKHKQAAAGHRVAAVELVAHMEHAAGIVTLEK